MLQRVVFILFVIFPSYFQSFEINFNFQNEISAGESRFQALIQKSYGNCWQKAISNLMEECAHLNEETQSRLAISFTNCFLEHTGSEMCPCPIEYPISNCLKNSSDRIFATYTEFYTHTQSICHYLKHKEWEEQTRKTVHLLTESSQEISKKLQESIVSQSKLMDLQHLVVMEQKTLITNGRMLNAELYQSRKHAKSVYEDFKLKTNEQRLLIFEIFDRVKSLQNLVLGEFTTAYTVVYYITGIFLIYILTSLPQTANARLWLILILTANILVEKYLADYFFQEEMSVLFPLDNKGPVYSKVWLFRKIVSALCFVVLLYFYYHYKDYSSINNKLLCEIHQQNLELQNLMKSIQHREPTSVYLKNLNVESISSNPFPTLHMHTEPTPEANGSDWLSKRKIFSTPLNTSSIPMSDTSQKTSSDRRPKVTLSSFSPLNETSQKRRKRQEPSPLVSVPLTSIENVSQSSPGVRKYNLRSRTNSPADISFSASPITTPYQRLA